MDAIRRQTRSLQNHVESLLTSYSKLAASASTSYSSSGSLSPETKKEYAEVETQLEDELAKLARSIDEMQKNLDSSVATPSASQIHTIRRHQEILQDYWRDFRRTQSGLREAEQRANLLGSVREEISAFKSSTSDSLLDERSRIDSSHRMVDDILGTAYETRAEFGSQRTALQGINARMGGVIAQIPGINSLMGMISSRRRRDTVILGSITGVCCMILLWMVMR